MVGAGPGASLRSGGRGGGAPPKEAGHLGFDIVIVDTAGRLHIDDDLMAELVAIRDVTDPSDRLYVADAMTGQDAIKSAGEFNRRVGVTGVVLTKLDGDARGGAALSVVSVVGVPIAFVGSGERLEDLEPFHPERVVSRVLGMGDVLSLIEGRSGDRWSRLALKRATSSLEVSATSSRRFTGGAARQILGCCRGWAIKALAENKPDEKQMSRVGAIINDDGRRAAQATHHQRRPLTSPEAARRWRINLLKQFAKMQKMLKSSAGCRGWAVAARPPPVRCCAAADDPRLEQRNHPACSRWFTATQRNRRGTGLGP